MQGPRQTYTEVSCDRAQQIDLLSFVSDPAGEGFAAFRKHYPHCSPCSAEVRAWNELHLSLQDAGGARAHPGVETLASFGASRTALSAQAQTAIESHLAACPACREELGALRRTDPIGLASPAAKSGWLSEALSALPGRLRGMVMHPAFAYGVALLLLYPALQGRRDSSPAIRPAESAAQADLAPAAESFAASSLRVERQTLAAKAEESLPEAARGRALEAEAATAGAASSPLERSPQPPSGLAPFRARFEGAVLYLELVSTTRDVPTEVRVIFPEGERELLQRFEPLRSRELVLDLPGAWLTNGTYRVGYRATGGHWVEGTVERGAESDAPK